MKTNRITALALLATVGTGVVLSVLKLKPRFEDGHPSLAPIVTVPAMVRSLRPTYPYSIIPGGVYSSAELQNQLRRDSVAQLHYADFHTENAHLLSSPQDHFAYVSYRQHGQVFWTKNKLRIPRGELLLTDGQHLARTRCGNRISDQRPSDAATSPNEPVAELTMPTAVGPTITDQRITFSAPPSATQIMAASAPAELPWHPMELPFRWASYTQSLSASPSTPNYSTFMGAPFVFPAAGTPASAAAPGTTGVTTTQGLVGSKATSTGGIAGATGGINGVTVLPLVPVAPVPEPSYTVVLGGAIVLLFASLRWQKRQLAPELRANIRQRTFVSEHSSANIRQIGVAVTKG